MSPIRSSLAVPIAALLLTAGLTVSCAGDATPRGDGLQLDSLALREAEREISSRRSAPVPPGLPESLREPASLGPSARVPLDEALTIAANRDVDLPEPPPPPSLSETLRLSASRMYTQARAALLSDRVNDAADLYGKVVAIDPYAGEAWSALASIRATQGDQPAALEAWRSALAVDRDNARALEQLGLAAYRRGELSAALTLLARARLGAPEQVDAALPYLLDAALAEAFEQSGSLLAAAEAAERAASAPAPFDRATNEQRRLLNLLRQRGLLLRGAGDMRLKLGDVAAAGRAYQAALELDDAVASPTLARAVYALRMSGADASAAQTVVRTLERSGGRIDALHLRLVAHLSETLSPRVSTALAEALPGVAERGAWADTPGAQSAAARLAAAGARSPDGAAELLLAHLARVDGDDAATEQLARTLSEDPTALADAAAELTARNPIRAAQFVTLFARAADDREEFEAALMRRGDRARTDAGTPIDASSAARLAGAWLALRTNGIRGAERALERFRSLRNNPDAAPYAIEGEAESLFALGRAREAFEIADTLADSSEPLERLLAGATNAHLQRHSDAYTLLRAILDTDTLPDFAQTDALLLGAQAAASVGQVDAAQRWLRGALDLSPLREDAYAGLIQIGLSGGVERTANAQAQLSDVVRQLRETIPTSRTLRLLQAREYASQGQPAAAVEILADLLTLDPRDNAAQEQYVSTLMSANEAGRAEAWLRERLESDDADPTTAVLLARVLTASDRADEAQQLLNESSSRFPRSEPILREREAILRGPLEDPIAADELALARLSAAPPTIENLLELAEVHARLGAWDEAAESLERALSLPGVTLRRDQNERLARAIGLFAASAESVEPDTARLVADAAGLLAESPGRAPDMVHRARVALLLRAGAPVSELISATGAPSAQNRDLALQLRLGAMSSLKETGDIENAFALAREGARLGREVSPEMLAARAALAVELANAEEAAGAIRASADAGVVEDVYSTFMRLFGSRVDTAPTADEFAYMLAQFFGQTGDEDGANTLYELALEYNQNHPWAANNFGYGLADRGEDLLRAYDLLQRAYAQLSAEVPVIDSIGWIRYRVGIFDDTHNAQGEKIEGAITLLRRAASLASTPADYVIQEHLGDALWRAGQKDEAVRAWGRAERMLLDEIARIEAAPAQQTDAAREAIETYLRTLREALPRIRERIGAVGIDGAEPDLPEVFEDLREPALRIPVPAIAPNRPGA